MRILPITELLRLTRSELLNLQAHLIGTLATLPAHSAGYAAAMINLRHVTDILSQRAPSRPLPQHTRGSPGPH